MTNFDSTEGIIFRVHENNPTDKLIDLLTEEGEKITLLAKNIKLATSKRLQLTAIGNHVKIKYIKGYGIPLLTDISVINEFLQWKADFKGMLYLQLICEVLNYFSFEDNPEPELFNILHEILSADVNRSEYLASIFSLKLLNFTGNLPELNRDVVTQEVIDSSNATLNYNGIGYIKDQGQSYIANPRIYKVQRYIVENSVSEILKVNLQQSEERQMLNLHLNWIESVIEKSIKSREVLREMGLI